MFNAIRKALNGGDNWVEHKRLKPSFDVGLPLWSNYERHYYIARSLEDGSRSDWIMLGRPDEEAADFSMDVWQCSKADRSGSYSIEGELLKVHRLNSLYLEFLNEFAVIRSRLGRFNTQKFAVFVDGERKYGIGFVSRFGDAPVRLRGWITAAHGATPSLDDLAATLDSLIIHGPLDDHTAQSWLAPRLARSEVAVVQISQKRATQDSVL